MAEWGELAAAFAAFFASHSLPVRPPVKARIVAVTGSGGFTLAYSALSVAVLTWLIVAAGRAPHVELWPRADWQTHVPLVAMAVATAILAVSVGRPNPLSFGGARNAEYDPARPGIVGWTRHPLLAAIGLWAASHMVPNGDLAHVLLFGTFLAFAVLGTRIIDRRKRRMLGEQEWQRLATTTRRVQVTPGGILRLALGAGLFCALLVLHAPVIGMEALTR